MYSTYFHFVLDLAAVLFFCGLQRLVGSVIPWYDI